MSTITIPKEESQKVFEWVIDPIIGQRRKITQKNSFGRKCKCCGCNCPCSCPCCRTVCCSCLPKCP